MNAGWCVTVTLLAVACAARAWPAVPYETLVMPPPSARAAAVPACTPALIGDLDGLLLDLDGTVWLPSGLVPGATDFYQWMLDTDMPHVFLSNTGIKGPEGIQAKFQTPPFVISEQPVPLETIYSAAQGVAYFLQDHAPAGELHAHWTTDLTTVRLAPLRDPGDRGVQHQRHTREG
eukprot:TRINITY_DN5585_c0_g1_i1.p1 TRINITY_DN5585_c0_g1~~TRINITY_DN5585_c0_g1_i1.p1  ORF type:complete len:187 (+),score=28.68 TRINITY_DN5585_c0_g1_i1:34-561(+)